MTSNNPHLYSHWFEVAEREQYQIAKEAFAGQVETLISLFTVKLPALEKEIEDVGGELLNNAPQRRYSFEDYVDIYLCRPK